MSEYCTCGSIKFKGNCTNKKCRYHTSGPEPATYKQVEYIKDMIDQLGDDTEYNYKDMTIKEASKLIGELEERVETGE
jgi:hypothetical protein